MPSRHDQGLDRIDLRARVDLYGFAIDTLRFDLLDLVFVDQDLDLVIGGQTWTDREKLKVDYLAYHRDFFATQHVMTNMVCDIDGDTAQAVTYANWLLQGRDGPPWRGQGWYEDTFRREADGWRIQRRRSGLLWDDGAQVPAALDDGTELALTRNTLHASPLAAALLRR